MNVTLSKRLPTFSLRLKNDTTFKTVDASGLYLNLKRISVDNRDGSIEIPLIDTVVDLTTQIIVVKSKYVEDFVIYLTAYEVDQIEVADRISAAKEACQYIFPKRKAMELTGKDGNDLFESVTTIFKQAVSEKKGND